MSRILIVEDNPTQAILFSRRLAILGPVDVAHSAAQARTLDWDQYQAIVLDILMEDETGIELLTERLATLGESRIPPTLLYTAMPLDYVPVPAGGWPKCVTLRQKDGSIKELLQTLETMIHETIDCSP